MGQLKITEKQCDRLGVNPYTRHSPLLEKCCLLLSANESYQNAEKDMLLLMGFKVGHSTHHRKVQKLENLLPDVKQGCSEVSVDGGTIRLRGEDGQKSYWKEYKTARLQGIYYGAFFQDNQGLIDWINSQKLTNPLYCVGDGHSGIWNIIAEIGDEKERIEILDWYHLTENLYKIEGKRYQKDQVKAYLWMGQVSESINYLRSQEMVGGYQFINYLRKHEKRLINYHYYSWQKIASIGSGAVESAVKQIAHRVKITGAQWKAETVNNILQLRCAYLNGQLAI